ncbi:MAG: GNAT family N-acetyltransferase [Erysipelotrichaceae bacterium]|nr:GNAT family N-acetyltransferase [Erysipelotrichaceae bacterium]
MVFWFKDKEVSLRLYREVSPEEDEDGILDLIYWIYVGKHTCVGYCDLRVGAMCDSLYYAGQLGYHVFKPFRGHSYAYKACLLLFEIARKKGMKELLITCSPDNIPSKKTLIKLGGNYVDTVPVPENHYLYERGETVKEIYRFDL